MFSVLCAGLLLFCFVLCLCLLSRSRAAGPSTVAVAPAEVRTPNDPPVAEFHPVPPPPPPPPPGLRVPKCHPATAPPPPSPLRLPLPEFDLVLSRGPAPRAALAPPASTRNGMSDAPIRQTGAAAQTAAAGGHAPAWRAVRVVEFDRLSRQVQQVVDEAVRTTARVEALQEELRLTRHVRHGLDVLQAVARQEQYPCGRALQRVLAQRLLESLKSTPGRPATRGRSTSSQYTISFDIPVTRTGLDELVAMRGISYSPRVGRRLARPSRVVQFSGAVAILRALDLWAAVDPQLLMCRRFTRLDKSKPARPLLESFSDGDGTLYFVLERHPATDKVVVSVREPETYDVRRQAFKDPLQRKRVSRSALTGLSEFCPCFLSWRESSSNSALEWEGADA